MTDHIRTTRGTVTESTHPVDAAVVSQSGILLFSIGNPQRQTLLRPAAKPAQSVAILEACGDKRSCTELMTAYGGLLVGKVGADGCYGVGIRESEYTRRMGVSEGGLGIAVKIESGSMDLVYAAVMEILAQLDVGAESMRGGLRHWYTPLRFNTMGGVTGVTLRCFDVEEVD